MIKQPSPPCCIAKKEITMARKTFKTMAATLTLVLFLSPGLFAKTHKDLVKQYLKRSGINDIMATFPDQITVLSAQRLVGTENPGLEKKVAAIMKESFDVKQAQESVHAFFLKNTRTDFLEKELEWLNSPLGKKITAEELAASRPEAQDDLLRYLTRLQNAPPSEARAAAIRELEATTGMSKRSAHIILELVRGMNESVNLTLPKNRQKSRKEMEKELAEMRPVIRETMREKFILSSYYAYRNISDKELARYIAFYRSDTGKTELDVTINALSHVFAQWFDRVLKKISSLPPDTV